jgi:tetratricopeptide (TPR) repeat protein
VSGAIVPGFFSAALTVARAADADKPVDLLRLPSARLEEASVVGTELHDLGALTDDDPATAAAATASADTPLSIVYGFGGETVSLEKLVITLPARNNDSPPPAQVDLLVSTLSPRSGFQSVRTDPLKAGTKPQEFKFAPIGARWIMLRFTPGRQGSHVAIAEVSVLGHAGPPVTMYKFTESPARALDVLKRLEKITALDVSISADEAALFADARDGKLDEWTFADAALLASGVLEGARRRTYLAKIDEIEAGARQAVASAKSPPERGAALLRFLHGGPMAKGYLARQTDLSAILDTGKFNCVSSATLYNVIGRRLGLDLRAIEVPHHAFSILYDGSEHADVETTTPLGFNPARDRAAQAEFTKVTGFPYIHDSNRDQRREVGEVGLVAITYYNHGVELLKEKRYQESLVANFRAMSLDAQFNSAVKNALAALANWSLELAKQKKFDQALEVVTTGLELAPEDATLVNNHKVFWGEWADALVKAGQIDEALAVLRRAAQAVPRGNFVRMQSWVFIGPGEEAIKAGDWDKAFAVVEPGLAKLDEAPRDELRKWAGDLYLRWSAREIKAAHFDKAADALERGLKADPADKRLRRQLGYVVQEWAKTVKRRDGDDAARKLLAMLAERFPDMPEVGGASKGHLQRSVQELTKQGKYDEALAAVERAGDLLKDEKESAKLFGLVYDSWAEGLRKKKDWQGAVDVYSAALQRLPNEKRLEQNAVFTWNQWAKTYMEAKDWTGAIKVLENGVKSFPGNSTLKQNVKYCQQQLQKEKSK